MDPGVERDRLRIDRGKCDRDFDSLPPVFTLSRDQINIARQMTIMMSSIATIAFKVVAHFP